MNIRVWFKLGVGGVFLLSYQYIVPWMPLKSMISTNTNDRKKLDNINTIVSSIHGIYMWGKQQKNFRFQNICGHVNLTALGWTTASKGSRPKNGYFLFFQSKFDSLILKHTFYLIVKGLKNTFFMPFSWLQMIIRRDRPLVNDHFEGPASCKWSFRKLPFSCVKSVSEHIPSLSGVKKNKQKNHEKLIVRWEGGGWSTLSVSLTGNIRFLATSLVGSLKEKCHSKVLA